MKGKAVSKDVLSSKDAKSARGLFSKLSYVRVAEAVHFELARQKPTYYRRIYTL